MTEVWVGIGFLILVGVIGIVVLLVYLFRKIKSLEKRNAELKHVEEHVIKMSELVIQNNELIATKLKSLENKGLIVKNDVEKIKEYIGLKN